MQNKWDNMVGWKDSFKQNTRLYHEIFCVLQLLIHVPTSFPLDCNLLFTGINYIIILFNKNDFYFANVDDVFYFIFVLW
jgi:hypothetical protein